MPIWEDTDSVLCTTKQNLYYKKVTDKIMKYLDLCMLHPTPCVYVVRKTLFAVIAVPCIWAQQPAHQHWIQFEKCQWNFVYVYKMMMYSHRRMCMIVRMCWLLLYLLTQSTIHSYTYTNQSDVFGWLVVIIIFNVYREHTCTIHRHSTRTHV